MTDREIFEKLWKMLEGKTDHELIKITEAARDTAETYYHLGLDEQADNEMRIAAVAHAIAFHTRDKETWLEIAQATRELR